MSESDLEKRLSLIIMGLPDPDGGISDGDMKKGIAHILTTFKEYQEAGGEL